MEKIVWDQRISECFKHFEGVTHQKVVDVCNGNEYYYSYPLFTQIVQVIGVSIIAILVVFVLLAVILLMTEGIRISKKDK